MFKVSYGSDILETGKILVCQFKTVPKQERLEKRKTSLFVSIHF